MKQFSNILVISVLATTFPCAGQNRSERNYNLGKVNGHYWSDMSSDRKVSFLAGFAEGYFAATPSGLPYDLRKLVGENNAVTAEKMYMTAFSLNVYFPDKMSYGDVVKGIDQFYDAPENLILPIEYALELITRKANGATQKQIEELSASWRRSVHDVEEQMKKSEQQK